MRGMLVVLWLGVGCGGFGGNNNNNDDMCTAAAPCTCDMRAVGSSCLQQSAGVVGTQQAICENTTGTVFSRTPCSVTKAPGTCLEWQGTILQDTKAYYSDGPLPFDTYCAQKACEKAQGAYTSVETVGPGDIVRASCIAPDGNCEDYIGVYWGYGTVMQNFCTSGGGTFSATKCAPPTLGSCRMKACEAQDEVVRYNYLPDITVGQLCQAAGGILL